MGISIVVPVYNSEQTLRPLCDRLSSVLGETGQPYEIILVNDASRDRSWTVIEELAGSRPEVRGICLMRNYGQHNALLAGIREAQHEITVTIDDDLQNPPEEIPKLLKRLGEGFDVVYGPPEQESHGLLRDLASQITKITLQGAMGVSTARKVSAFRVFRTDIRQAFSEYQSPYVSIDVLLTWGTSRFDAVPVRQEPRTVGASNYTLKKLVIHALNMLTGFSTVPLQVASILGFLFTIFGIVILGVVLGTYFVKGGSVPGFPFLASIVAIFSGAQLFALGIMGEYLARIHFRTMDRPAFVVRSRIGNDSVS